jgi:hypothetical protein
VSVIRENLRAAQMRQKSYHDKAKAPREFEVGNYVYLMVSPAKGVQRFGVKGKLAPRYIGESASRLLIVFVIITMQFGRINAFNEMCAGFKVK